MCGIDPCPLLQRVRHHMPHIEVASQDLFGSSPPSLFVGRHGYPNVTIGPMLPPEHLPDERAAYLDQPRRWMDEMSIADVVGLRSSLVRTTHKVKVADAARPDAILRLSQELAVAARPVDTEVHLARVPRFSTAHVTDFTAPHGPIVEVERATLAENAPVARRMEAVTSDTDLRAAEALTELYVTGTDPYQLERVLSAGMVGLAKGRRLVPTRWAITATDDTLGKALVERVLDMPTLDRPVVHRGGGFGNEFSVLLVPRVWAFDNVEVWAKGSFWTQATGPEPAVATTGAALGPSEPTGSPGVVAAEDWEDHRGRTGYAANTAGGYYATRLAVLEHLVHTLRRQATAIVLREITDAYTTPLGVWVVREACRRALAARPLVFEDIDAALRHMDRHARTKDWQRHASLLRLVRAQRTLDAF